MVGDYVTDDRKSKPGSAVARRELRKKQLVPVGRSYAVTHVAHGYARDFACFNESRLNPDSTGGVLVCAVDAVSAIIRVRAHCFERVVDQIYQHALYLIRIEFQRRNIVREIAFDNETVQPVRIEADGRA